MAEEEKSMKSLTRREFLKSAAVGATSVAGIGMMGACAPKVGAPEVEAGDVATSGSCIPGKYSWETAPDPIPDSEINQTLDTEVLIIGFGASGINAALRAAELGAKVTVLQKNISWYCPGFMVGGLGSRQQREAGYEPDLEEIAKLFQLFNGNKTEPALLKLWLYNSGKVMDWMEAYGDAAGKPLHWVGADKEYVEDDDLFGREYATNHMWFYPTIAEVLVAECVKKGVDIHYSTPAVQLIRKDGGRVTGAVAKDAEGNYIQVNASKGVILAAGDYASNPEMVEKYCPQAVGIKCSYASGDNTGDGQLMGMWVGGKVQRWQHAPMIHFGPEDCPMIGAFAATPWLWINTRGERFCDEDMPFNQACWAVQRQPENFHWTIFDSTFKEQWPLLGGLARWTRGVIGTLSDPAVPFGVEKGNAYLDGGMQTFLETGGLVKGDTLEELAANIKVPADTFVATVKRYNQMVDKGVDEDFGKRERYLTPTSVKVGPFYAAPHRSTLLTVPGGGVLVNTKLQVLDENDKVIPGLYATGNCAGGFYGQDYPLMFSGNSMGRATTWGYLVGESVVKEG